MSTLMYNKLNANEPINIGDLISLDPISSKVYRSKNKFNCLDKHVIGICNEIKDNEIYVQNTGVTDVNVKDIICIGDKITTSEIPGIAQAIKYTNQDQTTFGIRSIGKVIGLYNSYDKAKVLLDIE